MPLSLDPPTVEAGAGVEMGKVALPDLECEVSAVEQ
jgi:hypothetical protein